MAFRKDEADGIDDESTERSRDMPSDLTTVAEQQQSNVTATPAPVQPQPQPQALGQVYFDKTAKDLPGNLEWMDIIWDSVELLDKITSSTRGQVVVSKEAQSQPTFTTRTGRHPDGHRSTRNDHSTTLNQSSSQSYDFHECTSPEYHIVEWPFSEEKVIDAVVQKTSVSLSDDFHGDVDSVAAKTNKTRRS